MFLFLKGWDMWGLRVCGRISVVPLSFFFCIKNIYRIYIHIVYIYWVFIVFYCVIREKGKNGGGGKEEEEQQKYSSTQKRKRDCPLIILMR